MSTETLTKLNPKILINSIPIYPVDPATNAFSLGILYYNSLILKKNYLLEN